jgi:sugar phosphate permease
MLGIASFANFLGVGLTLSAFSPFLLPVSESFGVARSTIGFGLPIGILAIGFFGPLVGIGLDRGWARRMMVLGALMTGVGLILLSRATVLWHAGVLFCGLISIGASMFGFMPSAALATNWFVKRRGLALGITVAGTTIAAYVAPATAQALIDAYDWQTAVLVFGIATLALGVPTFALFVVSRPEEIGQLPDGEPVETDADSDAMEGAPVLEAGELVRDPRLWLVSIGYALIMTSPIVMIGLLVPFGLELGFTEQEANLFMLAMMPFSLLGKVVIGALADVAPIKPAIAFIVLVNMLVWYLFYIDPSYGLFIAGGALYGLGIGGAAPLQGLTVALCFGRANFGRASGIGGLAAVPLLATASAGSHALERATGDYHAGFLLQIGLLFLGGILLALVRIPRHEGEAV